MVANEDYRNHLKYAIDQEKEEMSFGDVTKYSSYHTGTQTLPTYYIQTQQRRRDAFELIPCHHNEQPHYFSTFSYSRADYS